MATKIKTRAIEAGAIDRSKQATGLALPAGALSMYGGGSAPTGWLLCDGTAVNRTTYADLFAAIGTTWGVGNGTTTFNVPDLRGRSPIGAGTGAGLTARTLAATGGGETHAITEAQLPPHRHFTVANVVTSAGSPTISNSQQIVRDNTPGTSLGYTINGSATDATVGRTSEIGSGGAIPLMQPFGVVNYIIKT